jgi:hypothetical protein
MHHQAIGCADWLYSAPGQSDVLHAAESPTISNTRRLMTLCASTALLALSA